jgi:phospholipid-transporting ATPase
MADSEWRVVNFGQEREKNNKHASSQPWYEKIRNAVLFKSAGQGVSTFCDNHVVTSKYSLLTFLPKFMFETFRKLANAFFLLICVMQCIPPISNTGGIPYTLPVLMFIVGVDAIFAVLEDLRRHKADNVANGTQTQRLKHNPDGSANFEFVRWDALEVGDLVKIQNREGIPADLLCLAVSEREGKPKSEPAQGLCYVETKSLDGETNLKLRQAMEATANLGDDPKEYANMVAHIECETPNKAINKFTGKMCYQPLSGNAGAGRLTDVIPYSSVLLRGCTLRNSEWAYGVVINTGNDTKIMQSAQETPSKWSTIEQEINSYIVSIVVALCIFCIAAATGELILNKQAAGGTWYLHEASGSVSVVVEDWIVAFFYFFLLMYQFVPISLYVSLTMVKFLQAFFMENDLLMYHEETDTPARVRSASLNEEIGQISHIFSDKTGTLTQNVMEFRKCSINGISYGHGTTEIGLAALKRSGKLSDADNEDNESVESLRSGIPAVKASADGSTLKKVPYCNLDAPELFENMSKEPQQQFIVDFFTHLSVCHTVIPEKVEGTDEIRLSASSPDEQALVAGASFVGLKFWSRQPGKAIIKDLQNQEKAFETLDVLEFNSTRKRQSVVVRTPDGKLKVLCKGADTVILARMAKKQLGGSDVLERSVKQMEGFAEEGLRTLMIAQKDLDVTFYNDWHERFTSACNNLEEIEKRKNDQPNAIDNLMEEIEVDLQLLGVTAIEDKLQEGVPRTISDLRKAGISVWVLTGDKEETAINIGFACQLIDNDMRMEVINMNIYRDTQAIRAHVQSLLKQCEIEGPASPSVPERAMVIDGEALSLVMDDPNLRREFMQFGIQCKSCIACRVSPAQKAEVVNLFREVVPGSQTLAIGDGANDVSMIQSAHVGVGISGQEGLQAVNASDFAIAQFRFLRHLLLRHGMYNYHRIAQVVLYMFYKNVTLSLTQYFYTVAYSAFSGQKYYNELNNQAFNVFYTALPIIFLGIFDKIVTDNIALKFPKLYEAGIKKLFFNRPIFACWMVIPIVESVLMFIIATQTLDTESASLWTIGSLASALVAIVVNGKVAVNAFSWHFIKGCFPFEFFFMWGSLMMFLILNYFLIENFDSTYVQVYTNLLFNPRYWLALLLVCPLVLSKDVMWRAYVQISKPEFYHIVQEASSKDSEGNFDHVNALQKKLSDNAAAAKKAAAENEVLHPFALPLRLPLVHLYGRRQQCTFESQFTLLLALNKIPKVTPNAKGVGIAKIVPHDDAKRPPR